MRQPGIALAMAAAGLFDVFGVDGTGKVSRLVNGHRLARDLAEVWITAGGKVTMPVQTNVVFLDLDTAGISVEDWVKGGARRGLLLRGHRIVTYCRECPCLYWEKRTDKGTEIEPHSVQVLKDYMIHSLTTYEKKNRSNEAIRTEGGFLSKLL